MKSMTVLGPGTNTCRALVLASSLALLFGLGLLAPAVEAWDTSPSCGSSTFPATGQKISYEAMTPTHPTGTPVNDDGAVQAGGALSYQDNGDGTITDLNTGLMWEKKSQDGSDHDVTKTFPWSDPLLATIWDWIDAINTEVGNGIGFAGYNDWRIPNAKELQSIVDYGRFNLAVDPAFNNNLAPGCTVLDCSATASSTFYWSATTFAANSGHAWGVFLGNGSVFTFNKGGPFFVRAVRGGCVP